MVDEGTLGTIQDTKDTRLGKTYGSQVLRLTLLAPEIVEGYWTGAAAGGVVAG